MRRKLLIGSMVGLALAGCNNSQPQQTKQPVIKVRGPEQKQLHTLDAFNLAIALKHAIYDAGYSCKRVVDAGYVGEYKNLDMWMAHCVEEIGPPRDWAVFTGPDGSAQIRDCKDIPGSGLPDCKVARRPAGSFTEPTGLQPKK